MTRRPRRPRQPAATSCWTAGAHEQAAALARTAAHAPSTTRAWPACWTACGRRARTSRPPRWPPGRRPRPPRRPGGVALLLDSLREAGAHEQAAALGPRRRPRRLDNAHAARLRRRARRAPALADRAAHAPRRPERGPAGQPAGGGRARPGRRAGQPGPPPTPPSTTRTRGQPAGQPAGGGRATSRPPRCWPVTPPPTPPSTTRAPWPGCWTACGRRARRSRPPRWPTGPPPTPPSTTRRRGLPAGQPAGGGRARAGRRAGRPAPAAGMFELFLEQKGLRGSVPFRTGGRRHPGRAMGLGRPGLMACSRYGPAPKPKR